MVSMTKRLLSPTSSIGDHFVVTSLELKLATPKTILCPFIAKHEVTCKDEMQMLICMLHETDHCNCKVVSSGVSIRCALLRQVRYRFNLRCTLDSRDVLKLPIILCLTWTSICLGDTRKSFCNDRVLPSCPRWIIETASDNYHPIKQALWSIISAASRGMPVWKL